jgi:hypothetical protein
MWKQWVNLILGLLVVVAAYVGGSMVWYVVLGLLIAILSLWEALGKKA